MKCRYLVIYNKGFTVIQCLLPSGYSGLVLLFKILYHHLPHKTEISILKAIFRDT